MLGGEGGGQKLLWAYPVWFLIQQTFIMLSCIVACNLSFNMEQIVNLGDVVKIEVVVSICLIEA